MLNHLTTSQLNIASQIIVTVRKFNSNFGLVNYFGEEKMVHFNFDMLVKNLHQYETLFAHQIFLFHHRSSAFILQFVISGKKLFRPMGMSEGELTSSF